MELRNKFKSYSLLMPALLLAVMFSSCKVTQPYQRSPDIADNKLYRDVSATDTTTIAALRWKQIFTDTILQSLIQEGINNNLDLKIAAARIKQADAGFKQSRLAFLPNVNGNAGTNLLKLSDAQAGNHQVYEIYTGISWEADLWGKLKSSKRAALAALLQSDAYKRAVQTQLVANIATSYYALMAYDAQLLITLKTLDNRIQDAATMKILKESNVVTGAAVVQSEANRYSVEVTMPDIKQNIRVTENAINILLGREPGSIARDSLALQEVPTNLNTGVPSQLLANRPDVQQAEYQLRYYSELVNVAKTYFYPTLTITAQGGLYNNSLSQFFSASSIFGNIVGGLTQPIFNNGLNKQRLKVAQAQQEEYFITFKQTLLTAGQEVSNALYDYQAASDKIINRSQQIFYLQKSVDYTKELLKYTSATNYTDVLTSEQSLLAAQLSSISDKLQQLQAVVTLYRSLGGGWK
ncbi:TolC family protein [Flavitalea sp.]|nr:TolC family protein [Flavitalea sp.]